MPRCFLPKKSPLQDRREWNKSEGKSQLAVTNRSRVGSIPAARAVLSLQQPLSSRLNRTPIPMTNGCGKPPVLLRTTRRDGGSNDVAPTVGNGDSRPASDNGRELLAKRPKNAISDNRHHVNDRLDITAEDAHAGKQIRHRLPVQAVAAPGSVRLQPHQRARCRTAQAEDCRERTPAARQLMPVKHQALTLPSIAGLPERRQRLETGDESSDEEMEDREVTMDVTRVALLQVPRPRHSEYGTRTTFEREAHVRQHDQTRRRPLEEDGAHLPAKASRSTNGWSRTNSSDSDSSRGSWDLMLPVSSGHQPDSMDNLPPTPESLPGSPDPTHVHQLLVSLQSANHSQDRPDQSPRLKCIQPGNGQKSNRISSHLKPPTEPKLPNKENCVSTEVEDSKTEKEKDPDVPQPNFSGQNPGSLTIKIEAPDMNSREDASARHDTDNSNTDNVGGTSSSRNPASRLSSWPLPKSKINEDTVQLGSKPETKHPLSLPADGGLGSLAREKLEVSMKEGLHGDNGQLVVKQEELEGESLQQTSPFSQDCEDGVRRAVLPFRTKEETDAAHDLLQLSRSLPPLPLPSHQVGLSGHGVQLAIPAAALASTGQPGHGVQITIPATTSPPCSGSSGGVQLAIPASALAASNSSTAAATTNVQLAIPAAALAPPSPPSSDEQQTFTTLIYIAPSGQPEYRLPITPPITEPGICSDSPVSLCNSGDPVVSGGPTGLAPYTLLAPTQAILYQPRAFLPPHGFVAADTKPGDISRGTCVSKPTPLDPSALSSDAGMAAAAAADLRQHPQTPPSFANVRLPIADGRTKMCRQQQQQQLQTVIVAAKTNIPTTTINDGSDHANGRPGLAVNSSHEDKLNKQPAEGSTTTPAIFDVGDGVSSPAGGMLQLPNRPKYTCNECGKHYATSSNLSRHKQTHRALDSSNAKRCHICNKMYVSMPALSMHVLTHSLNHRCNICGKAFSRPWLLQGHLRSHTGDKPYACNICQKSFADRSNLRAHMQTHSPAKNFQCNRCQKTFALKSYLNKHLESACLKAGVKPKL